MKKVLIVTYYWPPAGGPGVQRWLHFVKYLPELGIQPILYTPSNPHYPIEDSTLLNEVPKELVIHKKPIWEPYSWASLISPKKTKRISSGIIKTKNPSFVERLLLRIRGNFFIPDARKYWIKPSVSFLSDVILKEQIDAIITTGPPHSMHLIGLELKKRHQIKWLTDFRDPWTSIGYHKSLRLSKRAQKKHKELESAVLNSSDQIIVTSKTTREEFKHITSKPISVITNGYLKYNEGSQELDSDFTISHIGSLLSERNPKVLWQVIGALIKEIPELKKSLRIQLIGVVSDQVIDEIRSNGLEIYTVIRPYVPHKEALSAQRHSQVLLLAEINSEETKGIIPGKVFEYLAAKRPILAIGPAGWEAGEIIRETGSGEVFTYEQENLLKQTLKIWFAEYQKGTLESASQHTEAYSRKSLTVKLAELI